LCCGETQPTKAKVRPAGRTSWSIYKLASSLTCRGLAQIVELAGGTEQHVAAGDELGVFFDEDFAWWAEIELLREILKGSRVES